MIIQNTNRSRTILEKIFFFQNVLIQNYVNLCSTIVGPPQPLLNGCSYLSFEGGFFWLTEEDILRHQPNCYVCQLSPL